MSALSDWLRGQYGPGKRYRSARELALAAGLNQNTLLYVISKGRAEPETLLRLAAAVGVPARRLFVLAGWLEDEPGPDSLEDGLRRLTARQREAVRVIVEAFLEP